MTKNQWIVEWRERRIQQRAFWRSQPINPISNLNAFLHELYDYIYTGKQQVTISLVQRYKEKLSAEYLKHHEELVEKWKPEAKERASEMFKALVYCNNPFLSLIPKDPQPGVYFPVPIKYDPST